jgi:hypothetical protein
MHIWDAWVEANPADDGIDPDAWAVALSMYRKEFEKLVRP